MSFRAPIHMRDRQNSPGPSVLGFQVWCSVEVAHQVCCLSRFSKSPAAGGGVSLRISVVQSKKAGRRSIRCTILCHDILPLVDLKA